MRFIYQSTTRVVKWESNALLLPLIRYAAKKRTKDYIDRGKNGSEFFKGPKGLRCLITANRLASINIKVPESLFVLTQQSGWLTKENIYESDCEVALVDLNGIEHYPILCVKQILKNIQCFNIWVLRFLAENNLGYLYTSDQIFFYLHNIFKFLPYRVNLLEAFA